MRILRRYAGMKLPIQISQKYVNKNVLKENEDMDYGNYCINIKQ
jgi:hypothetical protein